MSQFSMPETGGLVVSVDLKQHQVEINFMHPKGPSISFTFPKTS